MKLGTRRRKSYVVVSFMIAVIFFFFSHWKSYRILLNQSTEDIIEKAVFMTSRDDKTVIGGNEINIDPRCAPGSELGFPSHCNKGFLGVAPFDVTKYEPNAVGMFTCLDGEQRIGWTSVNDDYCDCWDGSDEPGTGACQDTRFYCAPQEKFLPSSRINDGICDCCDGSDEWRKNAVRSDVLQTHSFNIHHTPCNNFCQCPLHCWTRMYSVCLNKKQMLTVNSIL